MLGLHCCSGFSLIAESRGYSLGAMCGLLIAVASLVVEHRLYGTSASVAAVPGLQSAGSIVVAHRFSCPTACGIFLD